jgi:plasmid replication initiation protein
MKTVEVEKKVHVHEIDLKKPVTALAITPKSERISALARKTYNVLLHISQSDKDAGHEHEVHTAPLSEIVHLLDYDSNDLNLIKKHLKSMISTVVEWQSPTTGEGTVWEACGLLAHCKIRKQRAEVWVDWSFAINLRSELLNPTVFARIKMEVVSQLRTHPAIFLYELACRYQNIGRSPRQDWRWWHDPMTGRPPDEARLEKLEYSFFKRDTLKPALAEVNAASPFDIELVEHRRGRYIAEVQFLIKKKIQEEGTDRKAPEKVDMQTVHLARQLGIPSDRFEQLVETYGSRALATALPELSRRIQAAFPEPVRDPVRYLLSIMPAHVVQAKHAEDQAASNAKPAQLHSPASQTQRQLVWRNAWVAERLLVIEADFKAMSTAEQEVLTLQLINSMEKAGLHSQIVRRLRKDGWQHPLVKSKFLGSYAEAAFGPHWNQPSDQELLTVASKIGDFGLK